MFIYSKVLKTKLNTVTYKYYLFTEKDHNVIKLYFKIPIKYKSNWRRDD
jgi:hypothetical protein